MNHLSKNKYEQYLSQIKAFNNSVVVDDRNSELFFKKKDADKAIQHLEMLGKLQTEGPIGETNPCTPECPTNVQLSTN